MTAAESGYGDAARDTVEQQHVTRPAYEASLAHEAALAEAAVTDRVHWGPVWTGVLGALAIFALLEMLVTAFGWLSLSGASNASSIWWSAIIGIIAFFAGGVIAQATTVGRDTGNGLMNGFAVWALGTALLLVIAVLTVGAAIGRGVSTATLRANSQTVAIGGFIFLLVAAIVALLGGYLGDRVRTRTVGAARQR